MSAVPEAVPSAAEPTPRNSRSAPAQWSLLAFVLVLAAAVVLPPLVNVGRYQHRIAESLSNALGRPVHMSGVRLRLVPRPGFVISNLTVEERPDFGAEPILRANSVVAYVRLASLWRGRLEVASIYLDEASLNLVHLPDGHWNFASVLVQAARTPNAPTPQRYAGSAPRFPYIEATDSRMNLKQGNEKTPLSFLNADLSIWLANASEWQLRFAAQPVRTDLDLDLADTGRLRISGSLRRAPVLNQMPLDLNAEWTGAPLGQLSRLAVGEDIGWRGDLEVRAKVTGTADVANLNTSVRINALHRAEFAPSQALNVASSCTAIFAKTVGALNDIHCVSPVGGGKLLLTGSVAELPGHPRPQLAVALQQLPVSAVALAFEDVRPNFPHDLRTAGTLNGKFQYARTPAGLPQITGNAEAETVTLSGLGQKPVAITGVRIGIAPTLAPPIKNRRPGKPARTPVPPAKPEPLSMQLQPARIALGAPTPITIEGRFDCAGFNLHVAGAGALDRIQELTHPFGLLGSALARVSGAGTAELDLNIAGPWLPPLPSPTPAGAPLATPSVRTEGTVALRNADLTLPYLARPIKIAAAQGFVRPDQIAWNNLTVSYGGQQAHGSVQYPVGCSAGQCPVNFALNIARLDLAALQAALREGGGGPAIFRRVLGSIQGPAPALPRLTGTVQAVDVAAGRLHLQNATASMELDGRSLALRSIDGRAFGGALHVAGTVDLSGGEPHYRIDTQLTHALPSELAALFGEAWGGGQANVALRLQLAGYNLQDLATSSAGTVRWDWTQGAIPASAAREDATSTTTSPLARFDQWTAEGTVADSTIRIQNGLLTREDDSFPVTGTITFSRALNLRSSADGRDFSATGTLANPQVETGTPAESATSSTP